MNLNIGCGPRHLPGFTNIDRQDLPGVDVVHDIDNGIPADDLSADVINARAFPAYVLDLDAFMSEVWRVLKPGGLFYTLVPAPGPTFWSDPNHKHAFFRDRNLAGWTETMLRYCGRDADFPHKYDVEWRGTLRHRDGQHDAHGYWLRKPGPNGADWRAVDAGIVKSGNCGSGYYSQGGWQ